MVIQTRLAVPPPTFLEYIFPDLTKLGGCGGDLEGGEKSQTKGPGPDGQKEKGHLQILPLATHPLGEAPG